MRIIGGIHRGTKLADVGRGDPEAALRPTSDRMRESLFNVLEGGRFGDPLRGARVLDLFAGTGALGLEALSRGAAAAVFVENGRVGQRLLRENIAKLRLEGDCRVLATDAMKLGAADAPCDLIFLDPPYGRDLGGPALRAAQAGGWVAPAALVVWEERSAQPALPGFTVKDQRRYGDSWVTFLRADG